MKITKQRLKKLIKEEMALLNEDPFTGPWNPELTKKTQGTRVVDDPGEEIDFGGDMVASDIIVLDPNDPGWIRIDQRKLRYADPRELTASIWEVAPELAEKLDLERPLASGVLDRP
jgi:hypothetical protein